MRGLSAESSSYRNLSYWHESVADDLTKRAALSTDIDADVAIIGGGLTGLWTAWYVLEREPALKIVVLEKEIAGFGASGRNGGWASALFPRSTASLERSHGREATLAMRRAMIGSVDEVGRASAEAGIDIDFVKGGTVAFARSRVQLASARADVSEAAGYGVDLLELWASDRVRASGAIGASFDPSCARIHPAKLVRGLARVLEARGVVIYEGTEVLDYSPHRVSTQGGIVRCDNLVVATEGYTATMHATKRRVLPLYSLMIATEPLPDSQWQEIGIEHGQTFTDYRHLLIYGQRTADNRFAFGGRGARYHWGSTIRGEYDRVPTVFRKLRHSLGELFPVIGDLAVSHTWGGPLGVPRDWHSTASFDAATGMGWAGGYVGDGLSMTSLAGRTLADLITRTDSELVRLPWVNHKSPDWEREPLRFVGANAGLAAMKIADMEERITHRPSVAAKLMARFVGH